MGKRKKKSWEPKSYWRSIGVTERKSTDVSAAALVNHGESVIMQVVPVALHVFLSKTADVKCHFHGN